MNTYTLQDKQTGNYLSENSFKVLSKKEVIFLSATGRCNLVDYYKTEERAEQALRLIEADNVKYNANKDIQISEVVIDNISFGGIVIENITIIQECGVMM